MALIWSLAALAALFLVWPVWRAFLPLEIWGNEGWNAYHADAAMRGSGLYPPADGLVANNYPPLSYYLLGWLGRLFGDPLYVGRALSILATLGIGVAAAVIVRQFGGSRAAQLIAGFWFVATMARFFEFYVGMNEPQILGLAVMSAGLAWFLQAPRGRPRGRARRAGDGARRLHQAQLHHAAAGRAALARARQLAARAARRAGRWRGSGARASRSAPGFRAGFHPADADAAHLSLDRALSTLGRLQFILPAMVLWAVWAWSERHTRPARFTALVIGIALSLCLAQKSGAGVDENAQFELIFATALGIGLAFDGLQRDPWRAVGRRNTISVLVLGVLIVRLVLSTRLEFAYVLFSPQYRALAAEHAAVTRAEAARVAAMPGPVACSNLVVCRTAGKPFVYDHFKVMMLLETKRLTPQQVIDITRASGITIDDTDPRAKVTSLWRRMRSD